MLWDKETSGKSQWQKTWSWVNSRFTEIIIHIKYSTWKMSLNILNCQYSVFDKLFCIVLFSQIQVFCPCFAANTAASLKWMRGLQFLMQHYCRSEQDLNTFPKMPFNQCRMYTSENIQVILESRMNSGEKWHTGLICLNYSLCLKPLMSYRTGFFYQPIAQYDLHYSEPGTRTWDSTAYTGFINKPRQRTRTSKSAVWQQLPTKYEKGKVQKAASTMGPTVECC